MGLSDTEIAMRLAALRRQREALDREIADLVLYQELGRRLGAVTVGADLKDRDGGPAMQAPNQASERDMALRDMASRDMASRDMASRDMASPPHAAAAPAIPPDPAMGMTRSFERGGPVPGSSAVGHSKVRAAPGTIPPAIAFTDDAAGARRYGRALVEAACVALARAGRPLHAAEILDVLAAQGFTLPGRDPVAALNTRLWKRSGPDGPLRRVGEATYALATDPAADDAASA